MNGLIFTALLLVAYVVVFPIVLAVRLGRARGQLDTLTAEMAMLKAQVERLKASGLPPEAAGASDQRPATTVGPREAAEATRDAVVSAAPATRSQTSDTPAPTPSAPWGGGGRSTPPPRPQKRPVPEPRGSWGLERVASNWMVWVGGLALGLSVVFLFRYAIDQGWLTPLFRVVAGLVFGGVLLSVAEWTRTRPPKALGTAIRADFIPPVLTGTGLFAVFVSLFAAHALYGLLGPATGFVALGLTAYAGLALSLRHGFPVAMIGLVTGYLVPALVTAPEASALPLFLYLLVLTAGCLAVMHWRKWWVFAYLTLAGAFLWPALWMLSDWSPADQGILVGYALGLAALFALLSTDLPVKMPDNPLWRYVASMLTRSSGVGFALSGLLLLWLADAAGYDMVSFGAFGVFGALAMGLGARRDALEGLVPMAAIAVLAVALSWPSPMAVSPPEALQALGRDSGGTALWRYVIPAEFTVFFRSLIGLGALFGIGGFVGLRWGRSPVIWAGVAAAMPVLLFVIAYWRIAAFEVDLNWAATAAVIAVLLFAGAMAVARGDPPRRDVPLGLFAAGTTAALSLAIACLLREAWLTVSLAVEVLALAWIWSKLPLRELRALTLVLASVVVLRLGLNAELLDYTGTVFGTFHWVLYGYGLPAVALWLASRLFRAGGDDLTGTVLEIAAAGFAFLMVALQLRLWGAGSLKEPRWTLFDIAVQILWSLTAAAMLLRRELLARHGWAVKAGQGLVLLSMLMIVLGSVLAQSPLLVPQQIGSWPVVNLLGLAYLAPAAILLLVSLRPGFVLTQAQRHLALAMAGCLIFIDLTLETRRAFWGEAMAWRAQTLPENAEVYAYSVVWILYANALLGLAILFRARLLRQASMVVLVIAVAKVFLYDMSDLTGLYRVASFLGLGVVLIAIARIYQRFTQVAPSADDPVRDASA
ncbi:DUF2339 domain-containing protein [Nioella nitratireducens]|uniref:DUF2339 domain-containing protein n=1 Tax=Nioella nitratireducens TaxID=1287720 RepID=UPI0008FD6A23|nr:DUF2339 domain-containing protein [Nioella nitratireducens]